MWVVAGVGCKAVGVDCREECVENGGGRRNSWKAREALLRGG